MERILVIEDDRSVQKALKRLFESENYAVQIAADGNTGLESFRSAPPDLVILDLNLPGKPGREVCREIKRDSPLLPLIVLSARTDVTDKVLLLELGADDYVTKPFSPKELLARVHTAMRRSSRPVRSGDQFSFDDIGGLFQNAPDARRQDDRAYGARVQAPEILRQQPRASNFARRPAKPGVGIRKLSLDAHRGQLHLEASAET
jgi:DNA-binding response OmpR family regulator